MLLTVSLVLTAAAAAGPAAALIPSTIAVWLAAPQRWCLLLLLLRLPLASARNTDTGTHL